MAAYTAVSIGLYFVSRDANGLAQRSLDTARENFQKESRPYVWLTNDLKPPGYIEVKDSKTGKIADQRVSWDWHFTNYGKTPARNVKLLAKMITGHDAISQQRSLVGGKCGMGAPLPPGKDDFSTAVSNERFTPQQMTDLINGFDGSILVYGSITYTDAYDTPYETIFCFHTLRTHAVQYCKGANTNYIE